MSDTDNNGTDETVETETVFEAPAMIHVPATVDDMLPPKQSDLITELSNLLRAHWDEVHQYYASISGEKPSIKGSVMLDEAACVFEIERIAKANGYAIANNVKAAEIRRAARYAYKRNTGVSLRLLEAQNRRLRIEFKQQMAAE
jgi:hypothetical protein